MKRTFIVGLLLIFVGSLFMSSCENSTSENFSDSINLYTDLQAIPEASNSRVTIKNGVNEHSDSYFQLEINDVGNNNIIEPGQYGGWCLEWKKPIHSSGDEHKGVKLYSTNGNDKWKPLTYLFSIKKELQIEDPSLTFREFQAVVWSLAGYMKVAPEFDLDKLKNSQLPGDFLKAGKPNFSKEKVKNIVAKVKNEYKIAKYKIVDTNYDLVIAQTESDEQDVVIPPVEVPGKDIVVYNDINIFDQTTMTNTNNVLFVQNLVNYTTDGVRNDGNVVWIDRGRDDGNTNRCWDNGECNNSGWSTMRSTIIDQGFTITDIFSTSGSLTNIPSNVKIIFLVMPTIEYTVDEINTLKQFADEGGRIIFIGEWEGFYVPAGIATENQFLLDMGAVLHNTGGAFDCGYQTLPGDKIVPHQITNGMSEFEFACFSEIIPGPNDFVLMYGQDGETVMGGVAEIDTTPIAAKKRLKTKENVNNLKSVDLNENSGTGY